MIYISSFIAKSNSDPKKFTKKKNKAITLNYGSLTRMSKIRQDGSRSRNNVNENKNVYIRCLFYNSSNIFPFGIR